MSRCLSRVIVASVLPLLAATSVAQLSAVEEAKLRASNPSSTAQFGGAAALDGDTAVVGARQADSTTGGALTGAAYIQVRNGSSWTEQARLEAPVCSQNDGVGMAVAISGDTVVAGAGGAATGMGAAHVFVRSGTTWAYQALLVASDGGPGESFGFSVGISGDTIVVGAPQHSGLGEWSGAAYVFVRSGTTWTEQAKLEALDGGYHDRVGSAVAIDGESLVVGAPHDTNGGVGGTGSAYVFVRSAADWTQQAKLVDPEGEPGDCFGSSAAISDDTAVFGSIEDGVGWEFGAGSVSVFVRNGATWSHQTKLITSDATLGDQFGASVAIEGNLIVAGARQDENDNGIAPGSLYVFARTGTTWSAELKLIASASSSFAYLGSAVDLSGDTVFGGAPGDDDASLFEVGSAFAVRLEGDWDDLGLGLAGVGGVPALAGTGLLVGCTPGTLALSNARPSAPCLLFLSLALTPTSFKGGTLAALPPALLVPLWTSGAGTLPLNFTWPNGVPSGVSMHVQYAIADPAAVAGVSLSNVERGTTP